MDAESTRGNEIIKSDAIAMKFVAEMDAKMMENRGSAALNEQWYDFFDFSKWESKKVENYWKPKGPSLNEHIVQKVLDKKEYTQQQKDAVILIQKVIRSWLVIRKALLSKNKAIKMKRKKQNALLLIQSCIRRWIAQQKATDVLQSKLKLESEFTQFCNALINRAYRLKMFSRKHATTIRKFFVDDKYTSLCCKINIFHVKKMDLSTLYKVERQFSGKDYVSKPTNLGLCISLYFTSGKIVDLEALDQETFETFTHGLRRMIFLMNGPPSRYVDPSGIPRRVGPSVIQCAVKTYAYVLFIMTDTFSVKNYFILLFLLNFQ
jgi:hypothetical protein